jgi:hypothetical protein
MSLEQLTDKYISMAEQVFCTIERNPIPVNISEEKLETLLQWVADYLEDAKYYKTQGKLETSLTSVAYCEGILDALRLTGAVKFEWSTKQLKQK